MHLGETCRPVLGRHQEGNVEVLGERNCALIGLVVRGRRDADLFHSGLALPGQVADLAQKQIRLDACGRVRKQHVTETAVEHAVVPNARSSSRNPGRPNDAHPVVSRTALELHGKPFHSHILQLLQIPLGGDQLMHQDLDVLVDGLMGIRFIRRHRTSNPNVLALEPGRMREENCTLGISHRVAEAPRQARVRTLLVRHQCLECRDVGGRSHVEVDPPLGSRCALRTEPCPRPGPCKR